MAQKRKFAFALSLVVFLGAAPLSLSANTAELNTAQRYIRSGFEHMKGNDYQAAVESFEQALRFNDGDYGVHLGLGLAYFHLNEDQPAKRELLRVIDIKPSEFLAYRLLGELSYREDDLASAISWWNKAVSINPVDEVSRARLDRIQREHLAEKDFNRDVSGHFLIKYEGRERAEAGKIILHILEDAYGELGRSLSSYPAREIQVILYSGEQFREVTEAPGWSEAVFDGKIRIPIGGIERETPGLRSLLYHEYTHALVRSITTQVPAWLNEGLAQYFEGREFTPSHEAALQGLLRAGKLPSLMHLEGSFMDRGAQEAALAYLFSFSAVRFMEERYGMHRIRSLLDELASGAGIDDAVGRAILISYEDLDREWRRSFEDR